MSCSLSVPLCSIATCVSQPSIALSAAPLRQRRCSDAPAFVASEQQTASRQASNRALQARHMPRDCPRTPIRPATPSPSTSVWQCPLAMPLTTAPLTIICAPPRHMASASHVSRPSARGRRLSPVGASATLTGVSTPALARPRPCHSPTPALYTYSALGSGAGGPSPSPIASPTPSTSSSNTSTPLPLACNW